MNSKKTFEGKCPKCGLECGIYHPDVDRCAHCDRRVMVDKGLYIVLGGVEYFLCDYCYQPAIMMFEDTGSIR
jgi:hypothetical protein